MDMYDSLFSASCVLNEQIARQIFDILPDDGPLLVIMGKDGHCWPSNSEKFVQMDISEHFLNEVCEKINDGDEPLITQKDDCSIVASQLATDKANCGYIIFALPQYTPESTMANMSLIELILNQVGLIARLIEKNDHLYELQMKQFNLHNDVGRTQN
ncbi:MAG: hypothetical protein ACYST9_04340 [Planctomycetota bacterium]|jgi:hypothetical protein